MVFLCTHPLGIRTTFQKSFPKKVEKNPDIQNSWQSEEKLETRLKSSFKVPSKFKKEKTFKALQVPSLGAQMLYLGPVERVPRCRIDKAVVMSHFAMLCILQCKVLNTK